MNMEAMKRKPLTTSLALRLFTNIKWANIGPFGMLHVIRQVGRRAQNPKLKMDDCLSFGVLKPRVVTYLLEGPHG